MEVSKLTNNIILNRFFGCWRSNYFCKLTFQFNIVTPMKSRLTKQDPSKDGNNRHANVGVGKCCESHP